VTAKFHNIFAARNETSATFLFPGTTAKVLQSKNSCFCVTC